MTRGSVWRGFANVQWPGRLEIVHRQPVVVVDGAHNADSMSKLSQAMYDLFHKHPLIVVLGSMKDKDIEGMVRELGTDREKVFGPQIEKIIATRPNSPRAAEPSALAELARARGMEVEVIEDVPEALRCAEELALAKGAQEEHPAIVLVTGSLYTVAEARKHYGLAHNLSDEED